MSKVITTSIERGTRHYLIYGSHFDGLMLYINVVDEDGDIRNRVQTFHCESRREMIDRLKAMHDDLWDLIYDLQYSSPFEFVDKPKEQINLEPEVPAEETEEDENDG